MTSPDCLNHFDSPLAKYVSIIICAPLKKSPNWASQMQSRFGVSQETPVSNPKTANSERELLAISSMPCFISGFLRVSRFRGMMVRSFSWSTSMTWRCENVPLPTSWPEILTLYPFFLKKKWWNRVHIWTKRLLKDYQNNNRAFHLPSRSRVPNAIASAVAQSNPDPWFTLATLFSTWYFCKRGCTI